MASSKDVWLVGWTGDEMAVQKDDEKVVHLAAKKEDETVETKENKSVDGLADW
jgi:hypothetical protein